MTYTQHWYSVTLSARNVNVNVHVYSPDILLGLHLWYWNTLFYSLISSGENSAFANSAADVVNHYNVAFSFYQVPITVA